MYEPSLARAVERFTEVTLGTPDVDLEREWAWKAYDSEGVRFAFFRTFEDLREVAVKTATERLARGPLASASQWILAQYHGAYRDLQAALLGLGTQESEREPSAGEWPPRRVVAHIVAAEAGFLVTAKYGLERHRTGDGRPAEIPDEFWVATLGEEAAFQEMLEGPLAGIKSYHQKLHERILREFQDVTEEELAVPTTYWEGHELSLRFRLHRFESHMRQHTVQLEKALQGIGHPSNEVKQLLRLIYAALAEAEGVTIGAWKIGTELWQEVAEEITSRADEIAGILAQS